MVSQLPQDSGRERGRLGGKRWRILTSWEAVWKDASMATQQPRVERITVARHARVAHERGGGMWWQTGSSSGSGCWAQHMTGLQGGGHLELSGGNQVRIVLRRQLRRRVDVRRQCLDVWQSWLALRRRRWPTRAHGERTHQAGRRHAGQHEWVGARCAACWMHYSWLRVVGRLLRCLLLLLRGRVVRTADQQCGRGGGLRRLWRD